MENNDEIWLDETGVFIAAGMGDTKKAVVSIFSGNFGEERVGYFITDIVEVLNSLRLYGREVKSAQVNIDGNQYDMLYLEQE